MRPVRGNKTTAGKQLDVTAYRFLVETGEFGNQRIGQFLALAARLISKGNPPFPRGVNRCLFKIFTDKQEMVPADHLQYEIGIGTARKLQTMLTTDDFHFEKSTPDK